MTRDNTRVTVMETGTNRNLILESRHPRSLWGILDAISRSGGYPEQPGATSAAGNKVACHFATTSSQIPSTPPGSTNPCLTHMNIDCL